DDFGDAPAAIIGYAEVANLARADEIADGLDGLRKRRLRVVLVQIVDIDSIGGEPLQAVLARLQDPAPRKSAVVRRLRHHVADLGRDDPAAAVRTDRGPDDR